MILKNRITMIAGAMFLAMVALAQDNKAFEAEYASTKNQWLAESEYLREYEGVDRYCQNVEYRETVDGILVSMHHLDSLIMQRVNDPTLALSMDYKEQKKTLKDISKLELEYSTKDLIHISMFYFNGIGMRFVTRWLACHLSCLLIKFSC